MTVTINGTSGITTPAATASGTAISTTIQSSTAQAAINYVTSGGSSVYSGATNSNDWYCESGGYKRYTALASGAHAWYNNSATTYSLYLDSSGRFFINQGGQINNEIVGITFPLGTTGVQTTVAGTNTQFHYTFNNGSVVGAISTNSSTTTFSTSSDYRLKENVQPMQNALDVVAQLNPVTYTWKADGSDGQGFIAHELQAVIPDAVIGEKDAVNEDGSIKPQGIDTSFIVATLTAAIQELSAKNDALEARIAALENK